jgi:hypothetical protein
MRWRFGKKSPESVPPASPADPASMPAYVQEFEAALERTERLGLGASPVRLVDIRVLDHVIVAGGETVSLAEKGVL